MVIALKQIECRKEQKINSKETILYNIIETSLLIAKREKSTLVQMTDFSESAIYKNLEILKKEGLLEREDTSGAVWILHYIDLKVSE